MESSRTRSTIRKLPRALGCKKAFSFDHRNHPIDDCAEIEIRARLIFLFRVLQVTTIVAMDPNNHYAISNPGTIWSPACAAEAACWMAGGPKDYPEHDKAGLKPARIREELRPCLLAARPQLG